MSDPKEGQMETNNSVIIINSYTTLYSLLDANSEKPYGIKVCGETTQTFWFATHEERNAVAETLASLALNSNEEAIVKIKKTQIENEIKKHTLALNKIEKGIEECKENDDLAYAVILDERADEVQRTIFNLKLRLHKLQ